MSSSRIKVYTKVSKILDSIVNEIEEIRLLEDSEDNHKNASKYKEFINNIQNEIIKNKISIEELKKPFLLFVVGSGNYGKSTLINVLLKDKIVETTDLPNTWKLDMFSLGSEEKMEIIYSNKCKKIYKLNQGKKILEKEEEKYYISKKKVSNLIKEYRKNKNYPREKLIELKKQIEEEYLYVSEIAEVHYYLNNIDILNDFIIVDTPGLNQNLLKKTKDIMKYYYNRADGIIWLIDAQNVVSKESNYLISEINELDNTYSNNKNIIGVVNKMDIIEQQGNENIEKVKKKTKEIYNDYFKDIVYISAKRGIDGLVNNKNIEIYKSNIDSLYYTINQRFMIKSEEKQIKSKYVNIQIMKDQILKEIENYKRELYKDISRYNESEYELRDKIQSLKNYILHNLKELKNKEYLKDKDALKYLIEDIKALEEICNMSLDKIYNSLLITSNISNIEVTKSFSFNLSFVKSKYLVLNPNFNDHICEINQSINTRKNLINNISLRNSKDDSTYKYKKKFSLIKIIECISEEITNKLDEKINDITLQINYIREISFKDYHLSYHNYKILIDKVDKIEEILNNMGGEYGI